jgi:UDP-N-acetylmuramoyl-L-alanyl-D-glutamate--2,6-diaminopimelate ligase
MSVPGGAGLRLIDLMNGDTMTMQVGQAGRGPAAKDVEIAGLTLDSRQAKPGYLFAALPGSRADGRDFIADALARGVAAVLVPKSFDIESVEARNVAFVEDANPRRRFSLMAARFFRAQPREIAAVTGTNGKTSVAGFTRQIWAHQGLRAASIGTLGIVAPGFEKSGSLTTPDPVSLHQILADLAADSVDHLAMEASSHGLDQFRLDGVRVTAAGFTNLSRDHLDYHGTMEAYLQSKLRLFDAVMQEGGVAVLNADVPEFPAIERVCTKRRHRVIAYGNNGADLKLEKLSPTARGQALGLRVMGKPRDVEIPLAGTFQAANVLCALGLAIAGGAAEDSALEALTGLQGAKGRMERVAELNSAPVYVDYAHTPDALENVLKALRPHAARRLIAVFGCGGDRDPGKRPIMGEIASKLADLVFVTDDNPRSEDPAKIRRAILAGCAKDAAPVREIGDRREAVEAALRELGAGDVLLLAGKGHERGQIVGDKVLPFDDAEVAREGVAAIRRERP